MSRFCTIEKFIELVENRPALYNTDLNDYRDKTITEKLWNEIGEQIQTTGNECKWKWRVLRSNFGRHIKNESMKSVCPSSTQRRKPWYLAKKMEFVRNYLNPYSKRGFYNTNTTTEITPAPKKIDQSPNSNPLTCKSPIDENQTKDEDEISIVSLDSDSSTLQISDSEEKLTLKQPPEVKYKFSVDTSSNIYPDCSADISQQQSTKYGNLNWSASTRKETSQSHISPQPNKQQKLTHEDVTLAFFEGLLPDIHKLSEKRLRLFKQETLLILNHSLDEQENESIG